MGTNCSPLVAKMFYFATKGFRFFSLAVDNQADIMILLNIDHPYFNVMTS